MRNVISVDIEEYFHPSEVEPYTSMDQWGSLPSRVEQQTDRILELFARHGVKGTFFVVGWVAERHPHLLRSIVAAGHEIGCHSYAHRLVYTLSREEFRRDTKRCVDVISNITGSGVWAYRAPSYSITRESLWALEVLVELGFTHDSSIYPISHDRYGVPGFPRHAHIVDTPAGGIFEVPIATIQFPNGRSAPVGGGAYLRLLPYRYTAAGIRKLNREDHQSACVYFHPWEIDPDQPRLARSMVSRLRTYTGLRTMIKKLDRLMGEFEFSSMGDVHRLTQSKSATWSTAERAAEACA